MPENPPARRAASKRPHTDHTNLIDDMGNPTNENNYAARRRLHEVEMLLWWRGWVRRGDLIDRFGISPAQASGDLQRFTALNPRSLLYDTRRKRYVATPGMRCVLHQPSLDDAVRHLLGASAGVKAAAPAESGEAPLADVAALPVRHCDMAVVRRVMVALLEKRWLRVRYASLASGTHEWRRIAPARFAWDGQRWHVRAWCDHNAEWRDFVPGRMSEADWPTESTGDLPKDEAWERMTVVRLRINPKLKPEMRDALRMDYGLDGDVLELRTREAMRPYVLASCFIDESHRELPRHFVMDDPETPDAKPAERKKKQG